MIESLKISLNPNFQLQDQDYMNNISDIMQTNCRLQYDDEPSIFKNSFGEKSIILEE
jgi:hypothetical protein